MELNDLPPTNRYKLLNMLGGKCRICPVSEIKYLEVDHIHNDGAEERTKYGSSEKIYGWYLQHKNQAFRRLQPLCGEHHNEKHYPIFKFELDTIITSKMKTEQKCISIFTSLEGENKEPVKENTFIKKLIENKMFSEEDARKYIRHLQAEALIYESKRGCYNRV